MPFTLAHPAAVIPIYRTYHKPFVLSALLIGALTPDAEYFYGLELVSFWGHTFSGLFTFCLPIGFVILWIYHEWQKNALLALLPHQLAQRWQPYCIKMDWTSPQVLAKISISLILGAYTHQIWDGFTHVHGLFVELIPFLSQSLHILGREIKIYRALQDISSAMGVTLLSGCLLHATIHSQEPPKISYIPQHRPIDKITILMSLTVTTLLLSSILSIWFSPHQIELIFNRNLVRHVVVILMTSTYLVITLYGLGYWIYCKKSKKLPI